MPLYPQNTAQNPSWAVPASPTGIGAYSPYGSYPYPQPYAAPPAIQAPQVPMPKTTGIFGRFVSSASEITPNEIPMDGSYSIFPTNDLSKIYVKSWNTDGTITTLEFSPVGKSDKTEVNQISDDPRISKILDKLENLEKQLG